LVAGHWIPRMQPLGLLCRSGKNLELNKY
jgi:hypothetical protein